MKELEREVKGLCREKKGIVERRIREFEKLGREEEAELFKELCFCIMTANFNAERAIKIQEKIGDGFLELSEKELAQKLKKLGHRYPNKRAGYIVEAREHLGELKKRLCSDEEAGEKREWLAENVKGLGLKEASHLLRNVGCKGCAIIDFHIIDLLEKHSLIEKPKTLTRKKYLEVENCLKGIAEEWETDLARLDLYLWCLETGKVLK